MPREYPRPLFLPPLYRLDSFIKKLGRITTQQTNPGFSGTFMGRYASILAGKTRSPDPPKKTDAKIKDRRNMLPEI
jgi:hypothetical protein